MGSRCDEDACGRLRTRDWFVTMSPVQSPHKSIKNRNPELSLTGKDGGVGDQ